MNYGSGEDVHVRIPITGAMVAEARSEEVSITLARIMDKECQALRGKLQRLL